MSFEFIKKIGQGTYGQVFIGKYLKPSKDEFKNKEFAIKRILKRNELFNEVLKEISVLVSFQHPNLLNAIDLVVDEKYLYIVTPLARMNLREFLKTTKLNFQQVEIIINNIRSGLAHLHLNDLLHLDLKPENILLMPPELSHKKESKESNSRWVIGDFGLTNFRKALIHREESYLITTPYRPPEFFCSSTFRNTPNNIFSNKADLWSFGIIGFEILTSYLLQENVNFWLHSGFFDQWVEGAKLSAVKNQTVYNLLKMAQAPLLLKHKLNLKKSCETLPKIIILDSDRNLDSNFILKQVFPNINIKPLNQIPVLKLRESIKIYIQSAYKQLHYNPRKRTNLTKPKLLKVFTPTSKLKLLKIEEKLWIFISQVFPIPRNILEEQYMSIIKMKRKLQKDNASEFQEILLITFLLLLIWGDPIDEILDQRYLEYLELNMSLSSFMKQMWKMVELQKKKSILKAIL